MKDTVRYSEAFKLKVLEELKNGKWKTISEASCAYGISATSINYWMSKYGFKHLKGRIIYVKTTTELDQIKALKLENKKLRDQLTDEVLDNRINQALLEILCRQAGMTVEEAKKKIGGK